MPTPSVGKNYSQFSLLQRAFTVHLVIGFLLSSLFFFNSTAYAATESRVNSLRTSILALSSARTTAAKELENMSLSTQETADYRDFIVYLNTRIIHYCRELAQQTSITAIAGLPCPMVAGLAAERGEPIQEGENQENASYPPAGLGTSQTRAEKTEELQDQFLDALGDFDEMLLNENKKVASRIPRQRETGAGGMAGSGMSSGAVGSAGTAGSGESPADGEQGMATEGSAADGASGTQTGRTVGNGAPGPGGTGKGDEQARAGVPEGQLPPPEDDDIVARQLREAAQKETDPELRKKLWEEYWKYKGVTPKGG